MKRCGDCKYFYTKGGLNRVAWCSWPWRYTEEKDVLTTEGARSRDITCGPEGKWWEAKE